MANAVSYLDEFKTVLLLNGFFWLKKKKTFNKNIYDVHLT